jgi:thiosulfate/3-mercaptopyruvate sulfurtransferase
MMSRTFSSALVFTVAAAAATLAQGPTDAPSFITPAALAADLRNPDLVLLHVGDREAYAHAHIPGARLLELSDITAPPAPPLQNELPAPADLELRLEALGIGDRSRVVVYFAKDEVPQVARVAFTLDYAGIGGRMAIVDGGLPAWVAAGQPVSAEVPAAPVHGTLTIRPRASAVTGIRWLRANTTANGTRLLDARPIESYTGADDRGGTISRPGHIPGATSLPYTSFFREDKTLRSTAEIEQMLAGAGFTKGQRIVTYCTSGVQATVPFVIARMLGYDVTLYDGSYQEWSESDAPVTR